MDQGSARPLNPMDSGPHGYTTSCCMEPKVKMELCSAHKAPTKEEMAATDQLHARLPVQRVETTMDVE